MSKKLYMIRRKSDGLFSMGGTYLYFTENGKIWKSISTLSSHINMVYTNDNCIIKRNGKILGIDFSKLQPNHPYNDCEIVEAVIEFKPKKDVKEYAELRYNQNKKSEEALE